MTPETFRRDKFLRASGYNLYVWAVVNLLVTWPPWSALSGRAWHPALAVFYVIVLLAAGVFVSVLNDNRVAKMWGTPSETPVVDAAAFWGPTLGLGLVLTVIFSIRGPVAYVQPAWLLLVGAGYLTWGNFGVPEFRWFGRSLIAAGAVAALFVDSATSLELPSLGALFVWMLFMGGLWLPFGAYVNRRYVHPVGPGPAGPS